MTDRDADLAALEALALKATPGPWEITKSNTGYISGACGPVARVVTGGGPSAHSWQRRRSADNRSYIAACYPDAILALIRRVREAEGKARAYDDIQTRADDAHRIAQREARLDAKHYARNVWHVCLDAADRADAAAAGMRAALERIAQGKDLPNKGELDRAIESGDMLHFQTVFATSMQLEARAALADPAGARVAAVVSAAEKWRASRADRSQIPRDVWAEVDPDAAVLLDATEALHAERGPT